MAAELDLKALREVYERSLAIARARTPGPMLSWERTGAAERGFILERIKQAYECECEGSGECESSTEGPIGYGKISTTVPCPLCSRLRADLLALQREIGIAVK